MSRKPLAKIAGHLDQFLLSLLRGLPAFACIILAVEFSLRPMLHGNLSDPDDYLYLVQALDWLKGQNWFDLIQHRMNPPEGTYIHFSHILSGFYGCLISILHFWMDEKDAALTVATIMPPIYLILLLFVMHWAAKIFINKKRIALTDFIILFSFSIIFQFKPGHIDHHGLEILLALTVFGCLAHMALQPTITKWPVFAGVILAFMLVIGLEALPAFIVFAGWVCLCAMFGNKSDLHNGVIFGVTLFVASFVFLALTKSPGTFFDPEVQVYSIVYVILTCSIALCLAGIATASYAPWSWARPVAGLALVLLTGVSFLFFFPQFKTGPYGGANQALIQLIVDNESEAWPLTKLGWLGFVAVAWPLIGLGASGMFFVQSKKPEHRRIWALIFLMLFFCVPLTLFYECRMQNYAELFAVIPLAYAIERDWSRLTTLHSGAQKMRLARLAVLFLTGPLAVGLSLHMNSGPQMASNTKSAAAPAAAWGCDMHALADALNDPKHFGSHSRIIINSINQGPEILFRTPHQVLAGPYFDVEGNMDTLKFFTTRDPAEARSIAKRRGAGLVIFCNLPDQDMAYIPKETAANGKGLNFMQQLVNGKTPKWLKKISSPVFGDLMVFEVHE